MSLRESIEKNRISYSDIAGGYHLTKAGYISNDGRSILSVAPLKDKGLVFISAPLDSITVAQENSERPAELLPLGVLTTMLRHISLGQKSCTFKLQHPYVNRYNKTFFTATYRMSLGSSYKDMMNICSYHMYTHARMFDRKTGLCEGVYREARSVMASLTAMLMSAAACGDVSCDTVARKNHVADGFADIDLSSLREALSDEASAIALVNGCAMAGCYSDFKPGSKKSTNKVFRHFAKITGDKFIGLDDESFVDGKTIDELISVGSMLEDHLYIVPFGCDDATDAFLPGGFDFVMSERTGEQPTMTAYVPDDDSYDEDDDGSDDILPASLADALADEDDEDYNDDGER